ncbi:tetraspanin 37 [Sphaeramia orbicularis]|uniref:Tetraspanin n=1 Tax=Sphaeramia orbicularis TaxID=375764 RepID=A0A673CIC4_9TELE|nr:tetraspanin-3-like [Sphaeramia orbicularis]
MNDQRTALKTILRVTCQFLWILGVMVGLCGRYLLMTIRESILFYSHSYITLIAIVAFVSAAFLVVSGCLGSYLSCRDSVFLQGLFVYLLVVIFCLESTTSALAYYHSIKLDSEMAPLSTAFYEYTGNSTDSRSRAVDATQEKFKCCGVHDYKDWLTTPWFNLTGRHAVPRSCCNTTFPYCPGNLPRTLYPEGCQVKLEKALQSVLNAIIWGCPLVFMTELFVLLTVFQLMKNRVFMDYQRLDKH